MAAVCDRDFSPPYTASVYIVRSRLSALHKVIPWFFVVCKYRNTWNAVCRCLLVASLVLFPSRFTWTEISGRVILAMNRRPPMIDWYFWARSLSLGRFLRLFGRHLEVSAFLQVLSQDAAGSSNLLVGFALVSLSLQTNVATSQAC